MTRWPPRPTLSPRFYKAHGLGNDYLVFEEGEGWYASPGNVRRVCDRFGGPGGDGIVVLLSGERTDDGVATVSLRMFNPDGGEFERSGNGLRVLGSFLARRDAKVRRIDATVGGGRVMMEVHGVDGPVHDLSVEMGRAEVGPEAIAGDPDAFDRSVRTWTLAGPDGEPLTVIPVSVGNPHVVVMAESPDVVTDEGLARVGPFVSTHPALAHGANVQLAACDGAGGVRACIWERGVGRTSASGTSACAVAVACVHRGLTHPGVLRVEMPGGVLQTTVTDGLDVTLRGPVEEVMDGALTPASLATFEPAP